MPHLRERESGSQHGEPSVNIRIEQDNARDEQEEPPEEAAEKYPGTSNARFVCAEA